MKISNTEVYTDAPTPEGERLMELVHEAAGMGCWHGRLDDVCPVCSCKQCIYKPGDYRCVDAEHCPKPAYLTSLDVLRPIWNKMLVSDGAKAATHLADIMGKGWLNIIMAQPHHHLEALARTLTVECPDDDCEDGEIHYDDPMSDYGGTTPTTCPTCSGTGQITVLDAWEREIKER